jgi:hypothetical protein
MVSERRVAHAEAEVRPKGTLLLGILVAIESVWARGRMGVGGGTRYAPTRPHAHPF